MPIDVKPCHAPGVTFALGSRFLLKTRFPFRRIGVAIFAVIAGYAAGTGAQANDYARLSRPGFVAPQSSYGQAFLPPPVYRTSYRLPQRTILRPEIYLPREIFETRERPMPRSNAVIRERARPLLRSVPLRPAVQSRALPARSPLHMPTQPHPISYCVRLCDGYAFPIGNAATGSGDAHAAACQLACPSAATALYVAPAGSRDIATARSPSGQPYAALKTAFAYRTQVDQTCSCRPAGASTTAAAVLSDFTMRPGDIVMTRIGMRMFEGARQFPYRAAHFADAIARLTDRQERARMLAMEAASLRGNFTGSGQVALRERIGNTIRRAERQAAPDKVVVVSGGRSGFEELKPRGLSAKDMESGMRANPRVIRLVERRTGIVALN